MDSDIEAMVASIEAMGLGELRAFWSQRFGRPPSMRSEPIMRQLLSWRVQVQAFDSLDPQTLGALGRTGPVVAEGKQLGIGARLTRQWKGREVSVIVEEGGFRWEDQLFPSLSAAATAIAGSRWNGPRFFGLRES